MEPLRSDTETVAVSNSGPGTMPTVGQALDPKHNSLNFLRLMLALAVVFSHSIILGGFGSETILGKTTLGTVAVYGFFGISGYLIAGSASRHRFGHYLWLRFLRIFPAFWVCLLLTAFGFGLLAWIGNTGHGTVRAYLTEPGGPFSYVRNNFLLKGSQQAIPGTLTGGIYQVVWNGSLWTLFYEFLCYLLLGILAMVGLLRRRLLVAIIALSVWIFEIIVTSFPTLNSQFTAISHYDLFNMTLLVPIFLTGSLVYLYRDQLPDSGWLALGGALLFASGLFIPVGSNIPGITLTSTSLTAVFLILPLLWLGIHLPFARVGASNDYSYGLYIYAFPIQQLLAHWGLNQRGYWWYTAAVLACTALFAAASWWLVERRALKLKKWGAPD